MATQILALVLVIHLGVAAVADHVWKYQRFALESWPRTKQFKVKSSTPSHQSLSQSPDTPFTLDETGYLWISGMPWLSLKDLMVPLEGLPLGLGAFFAARCTNSLELRSPTH